MQTGKQHKPIIADPTKSPPKVAYEIDNTLYLNMTNECTCRCKFCYKFQSDLYKGFNLRIPSTPNTTDLLDAIDRFKRYREVVFSGYGEPTIKLGIVKQIAKVVKGRNITTRLVTNGHGNLIYKKNIVPELVGLIDVVSVSLNADNAKTYFELCQPDFGPDTFNHVLEFIQQCIKYVPAVEVTSLDLPRINNDRCMELATNLGATFRLRKFNVD